MADQDYLVTARKYRPSLFKELVAQEHVADTLKNAIRLDRLAHAYLFSGPRGVGKTTSARILAKAINCETPREEREDGAEPCCECDSCTSFEDGRSLNVFEMDAASNNKVDDVRELREKVRIPPQGDQKKVYILDEVHMLSKQAFNALLKTLEEPPPHALFIFATTEPHKVLPTILSRCQRFDFRRIPVPDIVERLRTICDAEGIEADEESLMLLARKGDGALRDALSAFDQAISLCGSTLEYSELAQAMGVVDQDLYFDLTEHVATQNTAGVLELVRHVVRSGYDLQEFLVGLAEHLRNLLVSHSLGGEALEGVAESTRTRYVDESERFGEADLLRLLTVAGEAEDDVKNSPQPRLKMETTLLKMAQMRRAADLREVIQKIDRLERMAESGELPESLPDGTSGAASDEASEGSSASSDPSQATADTAAEPTPSYEPPTNEESSSEEPPAQSDAPHPAEEGNDADHTPSPDSEEPASEDTSSAEEETEFTPPDPSPASDTQEAGESRSSPSDSGGSSTDDSDEDSSVGYDDLFGSPALDKGTSGGDGASGDASSDAQGGSTPPSDDGSGPQAAVAEPAVETSGPSVEGIVQQWPQFVKSVKRERIRLGSLLDEAEPVEMMGQELTVAVPKSFHRDSLRDEYRFLLERLSDAIDVAVDEVRFVVEESSPDSETTNESGDLMSPREQLQELRDTYPALDILFTEFGAEPVW